ncbi:MAG: hypothetical protein ACK49D_10170 [Flavobacteriia bacterium]|jgi:hypothetical protein|nr:hypothetical protein [Cryomorphaceae bacterium]
MIYIGMFVVGLIGFILGEAVSAALRNDESGRQDDSGMTWIFKIVFALVFMGILLKSCS